MKEIELQSLIQKFLANRASPQEIAQLEKLEKNTESQLSKKIFKNKKEEEKIRESLFIEIKKSIKKKPKHFWSRSIAAVLGGVMISALGLNYILPNSSVEVNTSEFVTIESENKSLKYISGKIKTYTTDQSVSIAYDETKIVYKSDAITDENKIVRYNTIRVPNGKTIELILSDESKIIINSGSTLRYPVRFRKGALREVSLMGEAYFEISKNKNTPFIVTTPYLKTEVFGTQFNVSSYPEDESTSVVLVEGSLGVFMNDERFDFDKDLLIKPNEIVSSKNLTQAHEVDVNNYISWKDGVIIFRNELFENIITKLNRRFGFSVVNTNNRLAKERFTGRFANEEMIDILNALQKITPFKYKRIDNKIIIH